MPPSTVTEMWGEKPVWLEVPATTPLRVGNRVRACSMKVSTEWPKRMPWMVEAMMWPDWKAPLTHRAACSSVTSQEMSGPSGLVVRAPAGGDVGALGGGGGRPGGGGHLAPHPKGHPPPQLIRIRIRPRDQVFIGVE